MKTLETCPSCASTKIKVLHHFETENLTKCTNCKLVFCFKIPTSEELQKHYEQYGRNDYLSPITIKRYRELLQDFQPYKKNLKILDIGCGMGFFLDKAKLIGWEVYGTEFTDEAIKICSDKGISGVGTGLFDSDCSNCLLFFKTGKSITAVPFSK